MQLIKLGENIVNPTFVIALTDATIDMPIDKNDKKKGLKEVKGTAVLMLSAEKPFFVIGLSKEVVANAVMKGVKSD